MPFLSDEFEIYTDREPEDVHNKILSVVETQKFWTSSFSTTKPYFGEVGDAYFSVRRTKWNRRSITPVVIGNIFSRKEGSRIGFQVRLNWFEFVFYMLVFGLAGYIVLWYSGGAFLVDNLGWLNNEFFIRLIPLISFAFVYLSLFITLKIEAVTSRRFFLELLGGKAPGNIEIR